MTQRPDALLAECKARGIALWASGEALRFDAPAGALTDELRAQLREHKAVLLAKVRTQEALDMLPYIVNLLGPGDWRIVAAPDGFDDPDFVARHAFYQDGESEAIFTMARRCTMI
jgi:hypothetical protein